MIIRAVFLVLFATTCSSSDYFILTKIGEKDKFVESISAISKVHDLPFCRAAMTTVPILNSKKISSLERSIFFSSVPGEDCSKSLGVTDFFSIKNCIDSDYILKLSADAVNKLKMIKKTDNIFVTGIRCSIPDNYISVTLNGWVIGFKASRTTGSLTKLKIYDSSASAMSGWERKKISRSAAFQSFPVDNKAPDIDF